MPRERQPCGTLAAHARHLYNNECLEAKNAYQRENRRQRAYNRARNRAVTKLIAANRSEYEALVAEELTRGEQ